MAFLCSIKKNGKYTNLIIVDEVMGTFFMGEIFYDHLNKKDSKRSLILVIKTGMHFYYNFIPVESLN